MQLDIEQGTAVEVAKILRWKADMLRRRHPSDGLFQNAYTAIECENFKKKAARLKAVAEQLEKHPK